MVDELLLVERREAPPSSELVPEDTAEAPTMAQITAVTAQLPKRNYIHDTDAAQYSDDVSIVLAATKRKWNGNVLIFVVLFCV